MDEETKQTMKEQLAVSRESLVILKKMNRDLTYRRTFTALRYLVIVALLVFSYVQTRPYLEGLLNTVTQLQKSLPKSLPSF